jgi:PII-like signaling protein
MRTGESCLLLKVYISEDSRYKGHSLQRAVVFKLKELGIAGVTVTRAIEGYGEGKTIRTSRILDLSSSLPLIIEAVDSAEQIEKAIPYIEEIVNEGLILTTNVNVVKYGRNKSGDTGK